MRLIMITAFMPGESPAGFFILGWFWAGKQEVGDFHRKFISEVVVGLN